MFQHLLARSDHEACSGASADASGSRRAVCSECDLPQCGHDAEHTAHHDWFEHTDAQGRQVRVSGDIRYEPIQQTYHENATRRWFDANGAEMVLAYAPLALRLFFPQELEALVALQRF